LAKAKILVVEDEGIIAADIKRSVKNMGYEVAAVTDSGENAVKLAGQLKPDIVLMDIVLSGDVDGIEAAKKIFELYNIPVVYLTAHEDDRTIERTKETKTYGFILKPFGERDLGACLKMALSQFDAERKLRESEERYFRLTENARDLIFRMSLPDGRYEYVNRVSADITGYTPEEFYSNPMLVRKVIHPEWKHYFEVQWQRLLEGNVPPVYEFQIIHKSGEVRWMNQRNVLIVDKKKKPIAIEGIVTDITEQKKAEATIRKQQEEYRYIFDSVPAMIWYKDDNNKMLRVNKLAARVIGCTVGELEGRYTEEYYPDEAEKYLKDDLEVVKSGKPKLGIIEKQETASGEKIWVKTDKFPYRDEKGNIIGVLVFAQDITAQKRIEQELLKIERMNSIIFHTIPDMMFQLDKKGRFTDFRVKNKSELIFLPPVFLNKKTDEVLPEEIARDFKKHIDLAFKTYEPQVFEYQMKIKEELHDYECRIVVSGDNEVLAIIRDVTESKKTYRELQQSEEKYRKLTQNAPLAITRLLTSERRYELVNDEFVRQSGYTLDEFNNLPSEEISALIYPEDRQRAYEDFDKWMKNGYNGVCNIVYRIINKHGRLLWLNSYHYADFDSTGKLLAVNQIYIDISELKNSEEALRRSEAKFRAVAEISPVAIYILQGTKYVYGNPYVERLTGYRVEELLKMDFWEILHPDYREAAKERGLARQMGKDVPESYEAKIVTKDGEEKWIYIHATSFEYEGKPAVLGTTLDITEMKKAEDAIRDSE
jgi:PAS domain S-box-containing protein